MVQFKSRWIGKATNFKSLTCKSFGRDLFLKKCECVFVNVEGASVCGGLLVILFCPTDKRALVKGSGENQQNTTPPQAVQREQGQVESNHPQARQRCPRGVFLMILLLILWGSLRSSFFG